MPDPVTGPLGQLDAEGRPTEPPKPPRTTPPTAEELVQQAAWAAEQVRARLGRESKERVETFNPITRKTDVSYVDNGLHQEISDYLAFGAASLEQAQQGQVSASTKATIAQAQAALAQSAQQFAMNYARETGRDAVKDEQWGKTFEQSQKVLGETTRGNNLRSTLDLLQQEIATGTLDANEATTRVTAAAKAAELQRNVLSDWGGRALPAGTPYFPNAGPEGPLATAAAALGQSFPGFSTMGTFGIDPATLGSTITAAQGPSVVPDAQAAIQRAAAALAGMGVR